MSVGFDATVVGVAEGLEVEHREFDGVRVLRLPNAGKRLAAHGAWGGDRRTRDLRLLVGVFARTLVPELIKLKPDLIHSHDMIGLKLGAIAARTMRSAGRKVPWIHDLHEFVAGLKGDLAEAYMPICLEYERAYLYQTDHLVTVSDPLAAAVAARYGVDAPDVVYNTPKLSNFSDDGAHIRDVLGLEASTPLVVFVGGANELRGCDSILEAGGRLPDTHLAFVSEGAYVEGLVERAQAEGFGDRVHRHPYVPVSDVTSFVRSADVGIHGMIHYPNGEVAMPNKMFEYLHGGVPLAVSDVAGMKAFVEEHRIGLVFTAGDVDSCASTIRQLIDRRAEFAANITPDLKRRYSWEAQEEKISSLYSRFLSVDAPVASFEDRKSALFEQYQEDLFVDAAYGRAISEVNFGQLKRQVRQTREIATSLTSQTKDFTERTTAIEKRIKKAEAGIDYLKAGMKRQESRSEEILDLLKKQEKTGMARHREIQNWISQLSFGARLRGLGRRASQLARNRSARGSV
ncbi:MAG: glycosyltransferase family 4 protein [Parvularculaceae bacterium]